MNEEDFKRMRKAMVKANVPEKERAYFYLERLKQLRRAFDEPVEEIVDD